jgi:hypothetical protein
MGDCREPRDGVPPRSDVRAQTVDQHYWRAGPDFEIVSHTPGDRDLFFRDGRCLRGQHRGRSEDGRDTKPHGRTPFNHTLSSARRGTYLTGILGSGHRTRRHWIRAIKRATIEYMKTAAAFAVAVALISVPLIAQEGKPVPKDSVRVAITGCTKGYVFTAGRRSADQPGSIDIAEGTHLRMNGPKPVMTAIKAHEGSFIEITGVMKKGEYGPPGISLGGGVRISPGPAPNSGPPPTSSGQITIDVEGWRQVTGSCPSKK